jgi:malectin (di-glucose binding ER protein)
MHKFSFLSIFALAAFLTGCQSEKVPVASSQPSPDFTPAAASGSDLNLLKPPVRIDAGASSPFTDSEGNQWLPDQGFAGGEVVERDSDLTIANTTDPQLYRTEHYSMDSFSVKIPNGTYIVKLHFAETYEGITGPGQRVFSFNVNGQDFKNFDVWVKAGGAARAYVETVNVNVTDENLKIVFTPDVENPEINGIEILPAS